MKPFSESCQQNQEPIYQAIKKPFADRTKVLEIGSGTGQHAIYFAARMKHLTWITSDVPANHAGIKSWLEEASLPNIQGPLGLNVCESHWPVEGIDAVFSANTAHIMSWPEVELMFAGVGRVLCQGGIFSLYGPFNYGGKFTSESNAQFDAWLKSYSPESAVRDFEKLDALAKANGLVFADDIEMPANNRTLFWRR